MLIVKLMELQYLAGHGREQRDSVSTKEPFGVKKKCLYISGEMLSVLSHGTLSDKVA